MIKKYRRREKQISKIIQKMIKIDEIIKTFARIYIFSNMILFFIKKILQFLIIKYKKIDDQIKKQIHEIFQILKSSSFKSQIES